VRYAKVNETKEKINKREEKRTKIETRTDTREAAETEAKNPVWDENRKWLKPKKQRNRVTLRTGIAASYTPRRNLFNDKRA
jgi:hypothetical protein